MRNILSLPSSRALAIVLAVFGAAVACLFMASPAMASNTVSSATYRDDIGTLGTVDTIRWTMDENVTACVYESGDWTVNTAGTINVTAITALTCTGSNTTLNISVTASAGTTGGGTNPAISYANVGTAGSVTLTSGAMTAKSSQAATDAAPPVLKTITYQDADSDAKIDQLTLQFTESLVGASSTLAQNNLSLTSVGDFTGLAFTSASGDSIAIDGTSFIFSVTEASAEDTGSAVALTVSTTGTFSLQDSTGNTYSSAAAQSQVTFADGASPRLISASPSTGAAGNPRLRDVVLTFSEPIVIAFDDIALYPNVTHTETWSSSDTVLTLDGFWASGYNSVTFNTASDSSSNTFGGAQSGDSTVSSPYIFYTSSSSSASSSSSSSTTVTYDIDVTAPNGGEEYDAGDVVDITWTSEGNAMTSVNLNLMWEDEDGETVQETIVSGTANDGSYSWVVPSDVDSDSAWIQAVGTDLVTSLATDTSDESFTVGSPVATGDDEDDEAPSSGETGISPVTGEEEDISEVEAGMYIRSEYFSTVYMVEESATGSLVRRPFADAQTFMTWEDDWDDVVTVTDATLPTLALGSPMLPKAGVVLVKIQSSAAVYLLEGDNTLRKIADEEVAIDMYGDDWADYVIDVPVTLFGRFDMGSSVTRAESVDTTMMKTRAEVNS